ncbi:excinuclease ABC subunit C [Anaerovirgula multivorans]|uniref:Excinuclease ABC subunit C n=1 Tax=Anaerovirgula multivorans TaxID=312168 RepID=A0A239FVN7_9FIRM|nr:GIY-YIG nuclease family protein [Anaerovirgula multivorans]SNS60825.1 excinuclease ABC subunit C [Anaerovirgula multivorans]
MSKIPKCLVEKINSVPAKPGIYQMKDSDGNIIYIGKSKSLKSRVKSYFNTQHKWNKIKKMVFHIHDIDFIVTDTHLEAQLLECALIKKMKPIYNVQFKNDKKYKYLKIEHCFKNKPITIVDERENENCFGPYRSKNILFAIINFFEHIYPISKYENAYDFTYNMLPQPIKKETFEENKNCIIEIFSKKKKMLKFLSEIESKMQLAASEFQFETASIYRDILHYIKYLDDSLVNENSNLRTSRVLIGEKIENGYKIFYISNNNIILKKKYKKLTGKALEEFLIQAQKLENDISHNKNEKSDLDFKNIIKAEIRDTTSKVLLTIDNNYNTDEFINKLMKNN